MPTILAFGNFDPNGGRAWVIHTGLTEHGFAVTPCRTDRRGLLAKYSDLRRQWKDLTSSIDAVYVPFLGHYLLPLAWRLARSKRIPIVFDAFLSLHDTEVHDRKRLSPLHPKAWLLWGMDWLCCRLADVVLLDTEEHKDYFVRAYGVSPEKILVLPIGCRSDLFRPLEQPARNPSPFRVEFHGTFIPLQGIETILWGARMLQDRKSDVVFEIIGKGQTYETMRTVSRRLELRNVTFVGALPMEELPSRIAASDACLGIFGTTAKAGRVIPNKAYEILACGKPLITGDTPAARRVLRGGEHALLVEAGNPGALADAIERLQRDPALCADIGRKGRELFLERFQPSAIVKPLSEWLRARVHG